MPTIDRLARQWLETDEAFGITEVPIPRRASIHNAGVSAAPPALAPKKSVAQEMTSYAATHRQPPSSLPQPAKPQQPLQNQFTGRKSPEPGVPSPPSPPTRPRQPSIIPGMEVPTMAKRTAVPLPPIPAGNIADLPPISRAKKEAALQALQKDLDKAAAAFINDLATRVVFGEGDPDAPVLFIGEGPGAEEDRTGRPFVGRSGQLLDKMITAIGYKREQVYIANIVKLRAADFTDAGRPQDRPPTPEEVARGIPFLHRQIEIIRPKVIVTLGAPAIKHLTGTTEGVTKIRGTWLQYRGVPVMPTYHPSFVLRAYTEENRRKVWSDLKEAATRAREG